MEGMDLRLTFWLLSVASKSSSHVADSMCAAVAQGHSLRVYEQVQLKVNVDGLMKAEGQCDVLSKVLVVGRVSVSLS